MVNIQRGWVCDKCCISSGHRNISIKLATCQDDRSVGYWDEQITVEI